MEHTCGPCEILVLTSQLRELPCSSSCAGLDGHRDVLVQTSSLRQLTSRVQEIPQFADAECYIQVSEC